MARYLTFETSIPLKQSARLRQAVSKLSRDLEARREADIGWEFVMKAGRLEISATDVQGMDAHDLEQILAPFAGDHASTGFAVTGYQATGDGPDEQVELFMGPGDSAYQAELDYRLDEFGNRLRELGFSRGRIAALSEIILSAAPQTKEEREGAKLRASAERLHAAAADRYVPAVDRSYVIAAGAVLFDADSAEEAAARYVLSEKDVYAPCEEGASAERAIVVYGEQSGKRDEVIYFKGKLGRDMDRHDLKDGREAGEIVSEAEDRREAAEEKGPQP